MVDDKPKKVGSTLESIVTIENITPFNMKSQTRFNQRVARFLADAVIKKAVEQNIQDIGKGGEVVVKVPRSSNSLSEPQFVFERFQPGEERISVGNTDQNIPGVPAFSYLQVDDIIEKPEGGSGNGKGAGDGEDGLDEYTVVLNKDEMTNILLEGLGLPNMEELELIDSPNEYTIERSGFVSRGSPSSLHRQRTYGKALKRTIGQQSAFKRLIEELQEKIDAFEMLDDLSVEQKSKLQQLLDDKKELENKLESIPLYTDDDLTYRAYSEEPQPISKAVMFCLMDVSGSVTQKMKETSRIFFYLVHYLLEKNYSHVDIVFITHTTTAKEVDEEEFFTGRRSGGTTVASGYEKVLEIQEHRYPKNQYNVYLCQASDGDIWGGDKDNCLPLVEKLLSFIKLMTYLEVDDREFYDDNNSKNDEISKSDLAKLLTQFEIHHNFKMAFAGNKKEAGIVFREAFSVTKTLE